MTILIIYDSGFIGSNLLNFFHEKGFTIDVIDLGQVVPEFVRAAYHWKDIDAVYFSEYDAVIHLAGKAHDLGGGGRLDEYVSVNVGLTKVIFEKFLDSESANFIYFSSVKAVADTVPSDALTEDIVPAPVGPYGESKAMAERYILDVLKGAENHAHLKRVYILRPCMVHGPGNKGNLNLLYKVVKSGIPWPLGRFDNRRSFTSMKNLEFIIDGIVTGDVEPGVYNVGDDEPLSTNELIGLIGDSLGKRPVVWNMGMGFIKFVAKVGELLHLPLNSSRLKKLTQNYVVSNAKIKKALKVDHLPYSAIEGMKITLKSFING